VIRFTFGGQRGEDGKEGGMTISDVLMDAVDEIEDYQKELPALYEPVREEIERLKAEMREMVEKLNTQLATPAVLPFELGGGARLGKR
jgi:hypothetical protein